MAFLLCLAEQEAVSDADGARDSRPGGYSQPRRRNQATIPTAVTRQTPQNAG
jgi:hypothetical protein